MSLWTLNFSNSLHVMVLIKYLIIVWNNVSFFSNLRQLSLACLNITAIYISAMQQHVSFKKELLFSLEFPVLHMTAVFLVHKADDEDHIWSCEIHFGSTVEQDSKFFTFRHSGWKSQKKSHFQKITKFDHFWHFSSTFVHSKCKCSSLRSQCWMRLFLWFSTTVCHCQNPEFVHTAAYVATARIFAPIEI